MVKKKARKSKYISECYHVLKSDKQTKHGEYIKYSGLTKDNKVGIWITVREKGQVSERFDYDNNKKLPPIIQVNISYPKRAMEAGLQGTVSISYKIHDDCSISDVLVTQSLSADCDEAVINVIKTISRFSMKYGVDCKEKQETYSLEFKLD